MPAGYRESKRCKLLPATASKRAQWKSVMGSGHFVLCATGHCPLLLGTGTGCNHSLHFNQVTGAGRGPRASLLSLLQLSYDRLVVWYSVEQHTRAAGISKLSTAGLVLQCQPPSWEGLTVWP